MHFLIRVFCEEQTSTSQVSWCRCCHEFDLAQRDGHWTGGTIVTDSFGSAMSDAVLHDPLESILLSQLQIRKLKPGKVM